MSRKSHGKCERAVSPKAEASGGGREAVAMTNLELFPDIRSQERVRELGEVHTPRRIIDSMLDLFDDQTVITRPENRCLDPACGHGRFLEALLERKLQAISTPPPPVEKPIPGSTRR